MDFQYKGKRPGLQATTCQLRKNDHPMFNHPTFLGPYTQNFLCMILQLKFGVQVFKNTQSLLSSKFPQNQREYSQVLHLYVWSYAYGDDEILEISNIAISRWLAHSIRLSSTFVWFDHLECHFEQNLELMQAFRLESWKPHDTWQHACEVAAFGVYQPLYN